jgi:hypothetical protein
MPSAEDSLSWFDKLELFLDRCVRCGEAVIVLLLMLIVIGGLFYQTVWILWTTADCRQERFSQSLKTNKRQLESRTDYPNTPILSSAPSVLGESRGSGRSESSLQEENVRPEQGGIVSVAFFLHLGIRNEGSDAPDRSAIETVLNKAKDWYRYAPNCWIIYTIKRCG